MQRMSKAYQHSLQTNTTYASYIISLTSYEMGHEHSWEDAYVTGGKVFMLAMTDHLFKWIEA